MNNILVINRGVNTDNIGDRAINYTINKILLEKNVNVYNANYTLLFENIKKRNNFFKNMFNMINNFKIIFRIGNIKHDKILIGGGQLILDNYKFSLSLLIWVLLSKLLNNKKIFIYGVGVGSSFNIFNKTLYKVSINFIDKAFIRDSMSAENLKKITANVNISIIPDVVTVISRYYKPKVKNYNNQLIIGTVDYRSIKRYDYMKFTEHEYMEYYKDIYFKYKDEYKCYLFGNTKGDMKASSKLSSLIKREYNIKLEVLNINDLEELIDVIFNSNLVISGRMHALIIAYSYGVNYKVVDRNKKLKIFKYQYNIENRDIDEHFEVINKTINDIIYWEK